MEIRHYKFDRITLDPDKCFGKPCLFARIVGTWPEIEKPLLEGAIVALEDATFRIRRLPIAREE